ncbi:hypothetical protein GWK47_020721 [Chionoecetes opilio]|uniref:DNA helicase n=1 Tax=Chionoecetes opilio TaxID=41210 RepID=A0A8J5BW13_CHIOP|nr:hypothetical protein GWK47_020721 [Chionoecetes opilio]
MEGQMARWAEYFGQLFTVDPPIGQLHTTGLRAVDADPPIEETAPSLDEVREAVAKLTGGKAAGVCNISAELLKAGDEAMIRGLHAVLTVVWQSVIFAESLEVLVMALETLHEEAKPLGLEVSWLKTKAQVFGGLLDKTVHANVLQLQVITGPGRGDDLYLPRVPIITQAASGTGFRMRRLQFPIRVAFAMTINKCQGQTKSYMKVYLPTPVFTHGQLYVSLSRFGCVDAVQVLAPRGITRNVVYPEAL